MSECLAASSVRISVGSQRADKMSLSVCAEESSKSVGKGSSLMIAPSPARKTACIYFSDWSIGEFNPRGR